MSKLHSVKLTQSVLLEVAADVMRREKDTRVHVRFRCRLKPDVVQDVNRVEFWMAWNELSECAEEIQILKIRSEIGRSLNEIINDYDPSHEFPDWALRLVLRDLREDVEHEADVQTTTGQKRKLYEESRKTKNITTWKLLSQCKGYLSKTMKCRHKGTILHHLHKIAGGDILCATQLLRAISKDHPFREHLTDCRTETEKANDSRKLSYLDRMKEILNMSTTRKPCNDTKVFHCRLRACLYCLLNSHI